MSINIYVVEDDAQYRKKIVHSLELYQPIFETFSILPINNYLSFIKDISNLTISNFDIFFLDIDLKTYFSGIELATEIRKFNTKCTIIFLTSLQDKAISVINSNVSPLGYLVKNLTNPSELEESIHSILLEVENGIHYSWLSDPEMIAFSSGSEKFYLNGKDIFYIETSPAVRGKIHIHTRKEELIIDGKIRNLKQLLNQPYFYSSLRSYIINLSNISSISTKKGTITFLNQYDLFVGERILAKVKSKLKEQLNVR